MTAQKVVFAGAEMVPFAKVGGLADVLGSLPEALAARGHRVAVFLPLYRTVDAKRWRIRRVPKVPPLAVPWGDGVEHVTIRSARLPGSAVTVYFLDHPGSFDRAGIYLDPETRGEYADGARRWALFGRGVCEAIRALRLTPDIVHANDSHTALVPAYLKTLYSGDPAFAGAATVLSLHNLGYQGVYPMDALAGAGFPPDLFHAMGPLEFYGQANLLKAGIWYADMLTTVSRRYAEEIQSGPEFGAGLEGLLAARSGDLVGIVNGVDYAVWDPSADSLLPARYDAGDLAGKSVCKTALLARTGLPTSRADAPLIGMVTRLVDQKGLDILAGAAERLLAADVSLVVLGSGEERHQAFLSDLARRLPEKVAVTIGFHDDLAHLIEAGSDFFLMPSRYEPCGLNQLYSLRYGTIPIVRATGGLDDTIAEWNPATGDGTGFRFVEYTAEALLTAVWRALEVWADPAARTRLIRNGMRADFSWDAAAASYERVYTAAAERRRAHTGEPAGAVRG